MRVARVSADTKLVDSWRVLFLVHSEHGVERRPQPHGATASRIPVAGRGCFGLGAGFYGRTRNGVATLARHVVYAGLMCVALLFSLRLVEGDLMQFLDPAWNLKYTTQIESYAFPVGYAVVALPYLLRGYPVRQLRLGSVFLLVLLMLKGRTLIIDVGVRCRDHLSGIAALRVVRAAVLAASVAMTAMLVGPDIRWRLPDPIHPERVGVDPDGCRI